MPLDYLLLEDGSDFEELEDGSGDIELGWSYAGDPQKQIMFHVYGATQLLSGLVEYWGLQEAAGPRAGTYNGKTLTDNNTVTGRTGPSPTLPQASLFTLANSESLSRPDEAAFSLTGDWSACGWVLLTTRPASLMRILSKLSVAGNDSPFEVFWDNSDRFMARIIIGGVATTATASTFGGTTVATWYFISTSFTASDKKLRISINNGPVDVSAAAASLPTDTDGPVYLGALGALATNYLDGAMAGWGLWNRVLTAAEVTYLYNVGNGRLLLSELSAIRIWPDVAKMPSYEWPINGGPGSMTLNLPRPWGVAGEPGESGSLLDMALGDLVKIWVIDMEAPGRGVLIYQGIIDDFEQDLDGDVLSLSLISRAAFFADRTLTSDVVFVATDPTNMAKWFVDNGWLPGITWDASSPLTGGVFSYTFKAPMKLGQVYDLIQLLAGSTWFYRLNPDLSLSFNFWSIHTAPTHVLTIGKHVSRKVRFRKSRMQYYQRVIITGTQTISLIGTDGKATTTQVPFTVTVSAPGYDPAVEPRDLFFAHPKITEPGIAARFGYALLDNYSQPFYEATVPVMDSNFDWNRGYDIESFRPGHMLAMLDPENAYAPRKWGDAHTWGDGGVWGGAEVYQVQRALVISNVSQRGNEAVLTLRNRPVDIAARLIDLDDRLLLVGG